MGDTRTNPNGANQYQMDPRQKLCWELYVNPRSDTFGNACQSAQKAGYTETTALHITTENWFLEKLRRLNMLKKAEKVLDETLDLKAVDPEGKTDTGVLRIQNDTAKFLASTLGKNEGYASRQEMTGAEGEALTVNIVKFQEDGDNDTPQLFPQGIPA